ncbi:MAG TPA: amidase family protein, partial [bacterium]|nr:amidase family protein [bacterium]
YLTDLGPSPLMERLIAQGYIPIPCGLTAGANGGSGLYNGHGAVGNPRTPGHDTGGSSSAAAYILSLEDMPIRLAIGTDTGGSISAPCGAAKLYGWVPEKDALSRVNMIPFATHLDTPGVMGVDRDEVLRLAKALTLPVYQSHYDVPAEAPGVFYFEADAKHVSADSRANFDRRIGELRAAGLPVAALDERFAAVRRIPLDLYADSYVAAAFTLMNPLQVNVLEPQRYILDRNLQNRLAKAAALLKDGALFDRHLALHVRFRNLVHKMFPSGSVFVAPTPEAVPLKDFRPNGTAGAKLDSHDILGGMLKNRTDRALFIDPERRLVIEGRTGDILAAAFARAEARPEVRAGEPEPHLVIENSAALEEVYTEIYDRYPALIEDKAAYGKLVEALGKRILTLWKADEDRFRPGFKVPSIYVDDVMATLYGALSRTGRRELLERLKADDRKRKDRESHERLKAGISKDSSVFRAAS